ncbi:hypothetical protein [Pueribacillus sp. YX66]|uniref:hypothetical protein n=1 Tax=Pueribacillus sp. YX66 TaxID=3229242 RepID=UPI00358CF97D
MRLFYNEAKQLVDRTMQNEHTIIEIKKEGTLDYDLQVIRIQRALRKVYEAGFKDGLNSKQNQAF